MKNKGFTLIELLAVILILGIIALIAIPTVNNILKESRQGAFNASMQNIIKAAEEKCLTESMKGNSVRQFIFTNGKVSPSLDIKGDLPKSGIINLNENCEAEAILTDGDRKYVLTYEGSTVEDCTDNSCSFASNLKEGDEKYQCFNFDKETGTILKYDGSNPVCKNNIYIPAMIDGVPVVKINTLAFVNPGKVYCEKGSLFIEYEGTYIPKEEDGYCYGRLYENLNYDKLDMSDAGFLEEIGNNSFIYIDLNEIKFNDNLKVIHEYAFSSNNIKKIVLPKNLEYLGYNSFSFSNIEELVINGKITTISEEAFRSNKLKKINIPEGVQYIGESAFAWTEGEQTDIIVNLPNSLIGIGGWAFESIGVKVVNFGKNLKYIGENAFASNYIEVLNIPSSVNEIGESAFAGNKLTENVFIYDRNSDGTENKKVLNSYAGAAKEVVVPNNVEEIGAWSFFDSEVTSIMLPEGLKYIGEFAFRNTNLSSIAIPSTVEEIGSGAFYKSNINNPNLNSIINKTTRSFNWGDITYASNKNQVFEIGTISHDNGAIEVTK